MEKLCVFAASKEGARPQYINEARRLGSELVHHDYDLIYGGSSAGLMGALADQVLESDGTVIGVMPSSLFAAESVHTSLTRFIEVDDMHERKATMNRYADGFIALPGGLGTFEELFEVLSWAQLGIHRKPVGLFNIETYFDPLLQMIGHATTEGFIRQKYQDFIVSATDAKTLLTKMAALARG